MMRKNDSFSPTNAPNETTKRLPSVQSSQNNFRKAEILSCIAKGNWGTIYKVQLPNSSTLYALKVIHRDLVPPAKGTIDYRSVPDTEIKVLSLLNELRIPWVPTLHHTWEIETILKPGGNKTIGIKQNVQYQLMDLFDTDLFAYSQKWIALNETTYSTAFQLGIELGLRGILHGDLYWNQFLLRLNADNSIQSMVVSDFGFASNVLDRTNSWYLEGFTKSFWDIGFFHFIGDVNDQLKRKLFAIYLNVQQIVAALLFWRANVFITVRRQIRIIKSFSFGKYQPIFESLISRQQLKSIQMYYQKQMSESITFSTLKHKQSLNFEHIDYDFSLLLPDDVKSFLESEWKLSITMKALNQLALRS